MNIKNLKHLFSAALLTLVATAAYAQIQDKVLVAKIPFAFHAVGSDLPAGMYKVSPGPGSSGSNGTMELRNIDTGKSIFIASEVPMTDTKDGRPRLTFQCVGQEGCSLATLWSGRGSGLKFPTPALTGAQRERLETIYLDRFKGK